MLFKCPAKDYDVIKVWYGHFVPQFTKAPFHTPLEICRRVHQSKWDPYPFIQPPWCNECCGCSALLAYKPLVVYLTLIKNIEPTVSTKTTQGFLDSRDRMSVSNSLAVKRPIFLLDTDNWTGIWRCKFVNMYEICK